ncbi:MAG: VWA domain-containing protein, partial [Acidobacteria bacterium]|nr:VWA domain-containing protein [Acidobacteriota bacterium]
RPLFLCSLALLPQLLCAGFDPELFNLTTSKSNPESCASAVPAWNFGPNDEAVYISFGIYNVPAGMRIRVRTYQDTDGDFAKDSSAVAGEAVWDPPVEAGDYCYWASMPVKDESFTDLAGEWSVKVSYDDGSGFVQLGKAAGFNIVAGASSSDVLLSMPEMDGSASPQIKLDALPRDTQGVALTGLNSSNFTLTDNDSQREVTARPFDDTDRFSVALIVDSSTALTGQGQPYADEKDAAKRFVSELRPKDPVALYAMGGEVTRVQDFSVDRDALAGAIDSLPEGDDRPLYKAVMDAANVLSTQKGHRAIVLLSSGDNQGDDLPAFDEAVKAANAAGVPVVAAGFGDARHHILDLMALQTNGFYAAGAQTEDLPDLLAKVAKTMEAQYELSFITEEPASAHTLVLTARADDKESEPVTRKAGPFSSDSGTGGGAGTSRQGKMVIRSADLNQFVLVDLVTGSITPLGVNGYTPVLSPDASKLAYRDDHDRLRVRTLDSGREVLLSSGTDAQYSPTFVNNDTIAYLRENRRGIDICLSPVDTLDERVWAGKLPRDLLSYMQIEYVPGSGSQNPSFVLAALSHGLYLLSGDSPRKMLPDGTEARDISVSRDGARLAFEVNSDIYAVPVAGGEPLRLTDNGSSGWPAWSPDGRYLAFLTTGAVDRGEASGIGTSLFKIAIMDTTGKIVDLLLASDGSPVLVPGDRITWR